MRFWALLFLVGCCSFSFSQDFEIIHINPEGFPIIEAVVYSDDEAQSNGIQYEKRDFLINEQEKEKDIVQIINPGKKELPLSILLVFDISGSMAGKRIEIVQNAAINFVSKVPLQYSEVAITSFNEAASINCDFTHNRNKLLNALSNLQAFGGTSYTEAYLNGELGAVEFVKKGKHKKTIVFLTDGLSSIDYGPVIQEARANDISIYHVTVELPMPAVLKKISIQTGGAYYESAQSESELWATFMKLLAQIQSDLYGKIYWKADYGCYPERAGTIEYNNKKYSYSYLIPQKHLSFLSSNPDELVFGYVTPGSEKYLDIRLQALNNPVIMHEAQTNSDVFEIVGPLLQDTLMPDYSEKLTVKYKPAEEGEHRANLKIRVGNCPDNSVGLAGGMPEQVRITSPSGGDKLIVGTDTAIKWEGIKAEREVDIFYRYNDTVYNKIYLTEIKTGVLFRLNCIFFGFNSNILTEGSFPELNKVAELLNSNPSISIEIHGHTDNIGGREYNLNLSRSRAQSVKDYLVSKGIEKSRLYVKAYGYSKPIASNSDEFGRSQNRRVEIMIK